MQDVQNWPDERGIPIDRAGVSGIRYPIAVLDRNEGKQQTVAVVSATASVSATAKGTHMSRFVELLNAHAGELTLNTIPGLLGELREHLAADRADIEVKFTYFLMREAPITGSRGLMDYDCWFRGVDDGATDSFVLGVRTPVTSLCPCSKEISDYGAHNQRGYVTIEVESAREADGSPCLVWIEELVELAEQAGSCPVYPVLKRPDERHVTMQAFDNPVFVEDMVRDVAVRLDQDHRVAAYRVEAQNQESIHNHDAFAVISSGM
ncbi:MAG: GTP cyclohydrolase I FolE2 [Acidobacteria bacterium]|mgnify:CR=1 FL=1|jgi:GTP cyclohydrolase I|nr:GTP cyclohydrolase I FolE2 [Acidobacteriota bacterium]|tara:strand:- start:176 stop:967 length:792 start_codon:yes stop_codon:yes gene_type:complete